MWKSRISAWFKPFRWFSPTGDKLLARERGQALVRVVVSAVITLYLVYSHWPIDLAQGAPAWFVVAFAFVAFSVGLLWHILHTKRSPLSRRYVANIADIGAISFGIAATGETGVLLFVVYLWITLGNGFRYGNSALAVSAALSVVGFGVVALTTEPWQSHTALSTGVFLALIVLPIYAAHLIRQLNQALAKAEEANAAKGRFLARMSHELRTPLNGILGSSDLLEASRRLSSEERSLLQVIRDSVQVSLSQINNVLDFSKIEAGKLTLERTNLDLHEVINSAAGMVRPAATQKNLRLLVRIAPETPFRLVGDSHHLRAVLLNLLSNAVKFTEQGLVCVEASGGWDATARKAMIRLEVRDTGTGIVPEALDRIFESFTQEDNSTTRRHGGTGLGTTIAKQLVELMGGRIGVQSVKGQGSVFWCEIPFDKQQRAADQEDALPGMRAVLLSEDPQIADHYGHVFKGMSGQLLCVASSDAVVDTLARAIRLGNSVHAVFVDANLAISEDGKHRCDELCEKAASANVPIFLVCKASPFVERLREWGFSAVLDVRAEAAIVLAALHASPACAATAEGRVVSVAPWLWGRSEGKRPRILVADDNRTNLMIVRRMLEQAGYDVQLAETGDEALDRLYAGGYRLAVLDMHMPGLDGTTVVRQYRAMRPRSRLPIIVLTANASFDAQRECADAGADAYLSKPVTAADLLAEVERLLQDNQVETLAPRVATAATAGATATSVGEVLDLSVLAELDRLYGDPREMAQIVAQYEREGRDLLGRIVQACDTRSHPAFCDAVHALKGNAANIGGSRLMEVCQQAEGGGLVSFLREREGLLTQLQTAFDETLGALRSLVSVSGDHAARGTDTTRGSH
jgi:two-component system sensor histidine kinase RpfC